MTQPEARRHGAGSANTFLRGILSLRTDATIREACQDLQVKAGSNESSTQPLSVMRTLSPFRNVSVK